MSWPMVEIGSVVSALSGFAWKSSNYTSMKKEAMPIIRIQNVGEYNTPQDFVYWDEQYDNKYVVSSGDLLVSLSGNIKVGIWEEPDALLNQRIVKLIPGDKIDKDYLYYSVLKNLNDISNLGKKAVISNVSINDLKKIVIPLPPLPVQKKISVNFKKTDLLKRQCEKMSAELNALAQAVYLEMFGDPISNPLAWPKVTLDEIAEVQGGLQVTGKRSSLPVKVDYLRVANVYKNELKLDQIKTIQVTQSELDRTRLKIGDMLVVEGHGNKDEIGRTAVWDGSIENCTHQNHLIRVRFDESVAVPEFVSRFLNSDGGRYQINKICNTTSGLNTIDRKSVV